MRPFGKLRVTPSIAAPQAPFRNRARRDKVEGRQRRIHVTPVLAFG